MFVVFFLLWILMNGRFTWEIAAFGAGISAFLYFFICKFMDYKPKYDLLAIKKLSGFICYAAELVREIFSANAHVLKFIYSRKYEVEPALVKFKTKLRGDGTRSLLANAITLTPGTITASVEGDCYTVHCLDGEFADGLKDSEIEKILLGIEGGCKK